MDDDDFPYPHLDPEDDPNWVDEESEDGDFEIEEEPF